MNENYKNSFGTWEVTTEGDVEGRSTKHLGTHIGHVDEIALHLADKCYYSLRFKSVPNISSYYPKASKVSVSFDANSQTWDKINHDGNIKEIKEIFKDRPVEIKTSSFYASFLIKSDNHDEVLKEKALSKLSPEERRVLGI